MRATRVLAIAAVALAAACAKKPKPADLPPPPPAPQAQPAQPSTPPPPPINDSVTSTNVPGSAADFKANTREDRVRFAYDSYELDGTARAILDSQAAWLAKYPSTHITIEGHADERGTREYNLALGERRADAVKSYVAGKGFAASNIATISYGKERPEAEGSDEAAYARNRRAVTDIGGSAG